MRIAVMGSSQIYHLVPIIARQHEVIDLQVKLDAQAGKIGPIRKLSKVMRIIDTCRKADVLYNVFTDPRFSLKARLAKLFGCKVITHWIGTDVLALSEGVTDVEGLKYIDQHLVCSQGLRDELGDIGISADVVPIIPFNINFDIAAMPNEHAALIYLPEGHEEFYGLPVLQDVFRAFPSLPFFVVANTNSELFFDFPNVEVLGKLSVDEMNKVYDSVSIILRVPRHDGLSMTVIESLAKGKAVIWNQAFEHVLPGGSFEQIISSMQGILSQKPIPNQAAHDYITETFTAENFFNSFNGCLD